MFKFATALFVFLGGFAIMVLEIVGTRYMLKDFGGTFYVWVNQIGVILIALSLGYVIGGALADRFERMSFLAIPVALAGLLILFIPDYSPKLISAITNRHPPGREIPRLWETLDPIMGSAVVFFLPCFGLAIISPYMVRVAAHRLDRVGTISGLIYAASTVGSIAGVFISGYYFIDNSLNAVLRDTGVVTLLLALLALAMDKWLQPARSPKPAR